MSPTLIHPVHEGASPTLGLPNPQDRNWGELQLFVVLVTLSERLRLVSSNGGNHPLLLRLRVDLARRGKPHH